MPAQPHSLNAVRWAPADHGCGIYYVKICFRCSNTNHRQRPASPPFASPTRHTISHHPRWELQQPHPLSANKRHIPSSTTPDIHSDGHEATPQALRVANRAVTTTTRLPKRKREMEESTPASASSTPSVQPQKVRTVAVMAHVQPQRHRDRDP